MRTHGQPRNVTWKNCRTLTMNEKVDERYTRLILWLAEQVGGGLIWETVSADASQRRYFRARRGEHSWIAVDAPPEHEDNQAFINISELFAQAGLNAPRVLAHDLEQGFLCLTDLGDQTYLDVCNNDNADTLFEAAIAALLKWQKASRPGVLPAYDRATFAREMELFRQWYIPVELGREITAEQSRGIDTAFAFILDRIETQPPVYVHRDYMPRNLMLSEPMPGIIDFQDARYGPATYDVASLFRDAFISWPEDRIQDWIRDYWERARACELPVASDWAVFKDDLALMGAQRHLKVLGIFVRLAHRDGKTRYIDDLSRFRGYLRPVVERFAALSPLAPFVEDEPCAP